MEKDKRVTDANKVPLGRPPPNYGTGIKLNTGSSLLKPSYLTGDGYDSSRPQQYQAIPPPGVHIPSPHLMGIGHAAATNKMSTDYSKWSAATGFQFSATSSFSSPAPANISYKRENEDSNDSLEKAGALDERGRDRKRKRRSRWMGNENEKAVIPGMPTILPSDLPPSQADAYIAQLQIEELTRKLRTGDLGIPPNPEDRSPSPEPIYGTDGKRLNTREYRTRKKLEEERHKLIQGLIKINPDYKPPADYRAPIIKIVDRVPIPQEEHPEINFVGLLIGPRGNTLKGLEKDTGAKIIIRGKGSVKEGKVGGKAGHPLPGEDEPLHAYVTSNNPESVKKACENIKEIIRQGIEMPESQNDLRKNQLRELALLNGTLREGEGPKCSNCGSTAHRTWHCPDKPNITNSVICTVCGGAGHIAKDCRMKRPGAGGPPMTVNPNERAKIDEEYMSLMAELGESTPGKEGNPGVPRMGGGPGAFSNLFNKPSAPKSLMAPGPPTPVSHYQQGGHTMQQPSRFGEWNNANQPPPPGDVGNKAPPQPPAPGAPPPSWGYPGQYQGYPPAQGGWGGWGGAPPPPVPPPPPGATQPPPPGMYWQQGGNYGLQPPPPPPDNSHRPPPPPSN